MRVRYSRQAIADLVAIADYIRGRNPSAAFEVEHSIRSAIRALSSSPRLGRERPGLEARALRVAGYPYTVYYRIAGDAVAVLHIRDGRRREPIEKGGL